MDATICDLSEVKFCADSTKKSFGRDCKTRSPVCTRIQNDYIRTLKILQSMPEFGGLWKHQNKPACTKSEVGHCTKKKKASICYSISLGHEQRGNRWPLVPAPFLYSVPLHGMTFPLLSERNALLTPSSQTSMHFFFQKYTPAMFSVPCCCLHPSQVSVCCPF